MVWVRREGWQRNKLVEGVLQRDIRTDLLKKEFGTRIDMASRQIKQNITRNIDDLREFQSLSVEEFNLEIEKISDQVLSAALNAEFIHKNMLESFLYAKHELKRMAALREGHKPSPALIAMAEKIINMLSNIQKSLYSKDILDRALSVEDDSIDMEKLSEAELKKLLAQTIETP
ncbi:hypothetical protein [Campylobacter sp.]|uniref:hypothetical protein n=1 Tax=Campylobacter sp. TaxID=205 RepID=UPI0026DAE760|nr:hypothetical protein [Campylobacter sp.]MDO4674898.1 hypothetical protein [Campylobacter sp.]